MINQKQYGELSKMRVEKEKEYINALIYGVTNGTAQLDDGFAICPYSLLHEGTDSYKIAKAMHDINKRGEVVNALTVYDELQRTCKGFNMELLAESAFSIHGNEEAIKFLANGCRTEALKLKSEQLLLSCLSEVQTYQGSLDDVVNKVKSLLDMIESNTVNKSHRIGDIFREMLENIRSGKITKPNSTGYRNLDEVLKGGFANGELVILGARPAEGKTALAGNIAVNMAKQGKTVLFISREVREMTIVQRMVAKEAQIDCRFFREGAEHLKNIIKRIERYEDIFDGLPLEFVEKSTVPMTPMEIRRIARSVKNLGLLVVDYLGLITPDEKQHSREREVAEMSRAFKQMALDLDCPVLLLCQLNRGTEQNNREPMLSDLRESGSIEADADIVMFIHTDKTEKKNAVSYTKVAVAKGRSSGTGAAYFRFNKPFSDYQETAERKEQYSQNDEFSE